MDDNGIAGLATSGTIAALERPSHTSYPYKPFIEIFVGRHHVTFFFSTGLTSPVLSNSVAGLVRRSSQVQHLSLALQRPSHRSSPYKKFHRKVSQEQFCTRVYITGFIPVHINVIAECCHLKDNCSTWQLIVIARTQKLDLDHTIGSMSSPLFTEVFSSARSG